MSEPADNLEGGGASGKRPRVKRVLVVVLVLAGILVVAAAALLGGSYWWFTARVHTVNARIDPETEKALATPPPRTLVSIPQAAASPDAPDDPPFDIVLLGLDRPRDLNTPSRTDVIMLFHVDRARNFLSILSVPRDLYVDIPGYQTDRINVAYGVGGAALAITTIKNVLGINVTKFMEVNFTTLEGMINSLGGVYVDVDRRYDTHPLWGGDGLDPGYQLLDGAQALSYARYRFDSNKDFGRMARQQRILAALRDQATRWNLPLKLPGLVNGLLGSTTSNLTAKEMLKLSSWFTKLDGSRIKQTLIRGPSVPRDGKAVVVVDQASLAQSVTDFLTPPEQSTSERNDLLIASAGAGGLLAAAQTLNPGALPDAAVWKATQANVPFVLEAPTFIPEGLDYVYKMPANGGPYGIRVGGGTRPAVRMVYRYRSSDLYLGVTATTWMDAPIAGEGERVEANGVVYTLVGSSGQVDHIWWKNGGVLYFISNTLMHTLGREDMLKMAESMIPVGSGN